MRLTDVLKALAAVFRSGGPPRHDSPAATRSAVVINGATVQGDALRRLASLVGPLGPGRYWYDGASGLYGAEGGPASGQTAPGLPVAPMPPGVSGGGTGAFVNGREIHPLEAAMLAQVFGGYAPGRYLLDPVGGLYHETGAPIGNLRQLGAARGGGAILVPGHAGRAGMHIGPDGGVMMGDYMSPSC